MLDTKKPNTDLAIAIPWLAWIERTLGARVQMVCWNSGAGSKSPENAADPIVLGSPKPSWSRNLTAIATDFCRSRPPEVVAAGCTHLIGQALRYQLGGVPALVRVGSEAHPQGVILVGPRPFGYTPEELGLVAVAAQRISEVITREALQEIIQEEERLRVQAVYQRDAFIDFARGLPRARSAEDVCRHLLLFALGLTTATGGYVAIARGKDQSTISAVRGQVLVARPQAVSAAIDRGEPVYPPGSVIVPFRTDRLSGYLVLGGRLSGEGFGPDDAAQLEAACCQAALAMELHAAAAE
jgi:hypothetical protein